MLSCARRVHSPDRRALGVWLIINCFAYLAVSFTGLLFPQYEARVFNSAFPAMLGELAIMLWLMIKGAKPQPLGTVAAAIGSCATTVFPR